MIIKVQIFWEGHKNLKQSPNFYNATKSELSKKMAFSECLNFRHTPQALIEEWKSKHKHL